MKRSMFAVLLAFTVVLGCSGGSGNSGTAALDVTSIEGSTDVPIDSSFTYIFSKSIVASTVNSSTFFIVPTVLADVSALPKSSVSKEVYDETVCDPANALAASIRFELPYYTTGPILTPSSALTAGTNYTICLSPAIEYGDKTFFDGASFQFTAAAVPVTVTFSPADAATSVALDASVTATFSAAITAPSDWTSAMTLKAAGSDTNLCTTTYDSSTLVATCAHDSFDADTSYTVTVSGLTDAAGASIDAATASFTTAAAAATVSSIKLVRLDATELELTASPIPLRSNVKFTFSGAVSAEADRTAFESGTSLKDPADTSVAGTFGWAADFTSVTYTISYNLKYGTVYTVTIPAAFVPSAGLSAKAVAATNTFTSAVKNDINGDGYADLLVNAANYLGSLKKGRAYVFLGSASPAASKLAADADTIITGAQDDDGTEGKVSVLGDVNGDGYADIAVGMPNFSAGPGYINIFYGSATGIATCDLSTCTPDATINSTGTDALGYSMSGMGDINGDGYFDFMFIHWGLNEEIVLVFLGGASFTGALTTGDADLSITDSGTITQRAFGMNGLAGVGDVDGDHKDDVVIGFADYNTNQGRSYLFYGSTLTGNLTSADADATFTGENATDYFSIDASGGDINGDGYSDIIVGAYEYPSGTKNGRVYVFLGGSALFSGDIAASAADTIITGPSADSYVGLQVSGGQDVNNDGFDDLVVSGINDPSTPVAASGTMYLFSGSASGISTCDLSASCTDASITDTISDYSSAFGLGLYGAGDIDGDGNDDIIIGSYGYKPDGIFASGAAAIFYGPSLTGSLSFPGNVDVLITGENDADKFGNPVR